MKNQIAYEAEAKVHHELRTIRGAIYTILDPAAQDVDYKDAKNFLQTEGIDPENQEQLKEKLNQISTTLCGVTEPAYMSPDWD